MKTDISNESSQGAAQYQAGKLGDPNHSSVYSRNGNTSQPAIVEGEVMRSGAAAYDCTVRLDSSGEEIPCICLQSVATNTFGHSVCAVPQEGMRVLVMLPSTLNGHGIILGVIPPANTVSPNGERTTYSRRLRPDPEAGYHKDASYTVPYENTKYLRKYNGNSERPIDNIPGEYAILNENDCGFHTGMFSSEIRAGHASVITSRIDDTVRIVSTNLQMYNIFKFDDVFNDFAYITEEEKCSFHQGERLGRNDKTGSGAYEISEPKTEGDPEYFVQNKKPRQTQKARYKSFRGFLGSYITEFLGRPDKDIDILSHDDNPRDSGVYRTNVDGSGSVFTRSAGGISLERYDRIPVPFRKREPWDPKGDREINPEAIEKFEWSAENKYYRPLELYDAIAWDSKCTYQRFDELKKDFYTPEEGDIKPLEDVYDPEITGSQTKDLESNNKRRAGIYIGENGSIIIRDAWGSEIVMQGGCITLSAASFINVLPGKTALIQAGDDIVVKAKNSIDINASEHDVRIKAERNLGMVAGSDDSSGGVLIESMATSEAPFDAGEKGDNNPGETVFMSGITLKAKKSSVVVEGNNARVFAHTGVTVLTGEDKDKREGHVDVMTDRLNSCANTINLFTEKSNITLSDSITVASDSSVLVAAQSNVNLVQGTKIAGILWVSTGDHSIASEIVSSLKDMYKLYQEDTVCSPFTLEALEKMRFVYRNSDECNTTSPMEIMDKPGEFTMYQPHWVTLHNMYPDMEPEDTEAWGDDHKVYGGLAWPGAKTLGKGKYATLSKPVNLGTENVYSISRDKLSKKSNVKLKSLTEYDVIKS